MIFSQKVKLFYKIIKNLYQNYVSILEQYLSSIFLLVVRIWIGLVFFKSGLTKIANIHQTVLLFSYEYNVPLLSPKLAALISTAFELGCGLAIIIGLLTRIASLPLIAMACVIQLFIFQNTEHFYWMFLLTTLAIYGGGQISVDGILRRIYKPKNGIIQPKYK